MTAANWLQLFALLLLIGIATPLFGGYLAKVYGGGRASGDRIFLPVERTIYRLVGVDERRQQRWTMYAASLLAFSLTSVVVLYTLLRVQSVLPLNPNDVPTVPAALAFNTATSFGTNTNWQNYAAESSMSHFSQVAGLTVQNFVSAAVGIAVAVALIRGLALRRATTIGNFWVDLTRSVTHVLPRSAFSRRSCSSAREPSRTCAVSPRRRPSKARRRSLQPARLRAKRPSKNSGPTAADR